MKLWHSILLLLLILAYTGCRVGGSFKNPEVSQTPGQYPQNTNNIDSITEIKWWELYQDTVLQRFIHTALDSNRNMLAAAARIEQSREIAGIVKANLYPSFGYQATAGGGQAGTDAQKVAGGIDKGLISAFATLNWEIDLWGKIRSQRDASYNQFIADTENRNALIVSLVGQMAELYFLLRDLDNRLAIAQRTVASRQESLRIITERFNKGYIAEVDKLQAEIQLYEAAAVVQQFLRQITITENAIHTLMGQGPGPLPRGQSLYDQTVQPDIPAGLPSQLLQRRPDIREALKRLEAQFNEIGVAKARMYPSFSITGILGFASPELSTLISSKGFVANGFGGVVGPIFQFNQNKRLVRVQEYKTTELTRQYEQTVINAFAEVDNALAQYRTSAEEHDIRSKQVMSAKKALELVQAKYDYGYSSYYEVLIQENYLFDAELQESFTLQSQLTAIVGLYKALGGGWNAQ